LEASDEDLRVTSKSLNASSVNAAFHTHYNVDLAGTIEGMLECVGVSRLTIGPNLAMKVQFISMTAHSFIR